MDERDRFDTLLSYLETLGSQPSAKPWLAELHSAASTLRLDLTRARETQGELLAKSNEDDLVIDCYKKAESRWADSEAAYEQSLSTTQAELANSKERHRLTELDACNANSRANELQARLDAAKDPRAHQGALVQYRDKCDVAEEALAALRARVVEVGRPFTERWRNHKSGYIASIPMVPVLREDVQAMADLIEEVSKVAP